MSDTLRTFIAIDVIEPVRRHIETVQSKLSSVEGARVAWPRVNGLHITLKFLGDVERDMIVDITDSIRSVTETIDPFTIRTSESGAFPNLKRPNVLWWGLDANMSLMTLQSAIEDCLSDMDLENDTKGFNPHLTIGRVKSLAKDSNLVEMFQKCDFPMFEWKVEEVNIMSSFLHASGAIYKRLASVPLKGIS